MLNRLWIAMAGLAVAAAVTGCGGDDEPKATATPVASSATATVAATNTAKPLATATVAPDGTIDPLGAGGTERWVVKALPETFTGNIVLKDVRMGVHPELGGWERIVFEFAGTARPAAVIEYVPAVAQCGSGQALALKGSAVLSFRFEHAAAHDDQGKATFASTSLPGPGNTILETKQWCDFEGVLGWAAGMKGKQNFKVMTLENPVRIVVDVKQ